MKTTFIVALLVAACPIAFGQAAPSATAGGAYLRYSARYAEAAEFGGSLGTWHTITPSASLGYSNGRKHFPFSLEYAGGYTATPSGPGYTTGLFQHLFVSQKIEHGKWDLGLSDDVSYRPQTATTGFSGISGTGEPIGGGTNVPADQFILAMNTHALENIAHGEHRQILNPYIILNVHASHELLHFPDRNGLDTTSMIASGGLNFRLDARNALTTQYSFANFTYSSYDLSIRTNSGTLGLKRNWTRSLFIEAAAGPEWLSSSNSAVISDSIGVAAHANLNYQRRQTSMIVNYVRKTSSGSGYMIGSESYGVSAGLTRQINRPLSVEMQVGYSDNSALTPKWSTSGIYGGIQGSRRIGRNLNAFVNYTATAQSAKNQGRANVQNDMIHTLSCGVAFARETKSSQ